jgi:hypothetical protein
MQFLFIIFLNKNFPRWRCSFREEEIEGDMTFTNEKGVHCIALSHTYLPTAPAVGAGGEEHGA